MIICARRAVSDKEIRKAVTSGYDDFVDLMELLGIADECGTCFDAAYKVFEDELENN